MKNREFKAFHPILTRFGVAKDSVLIVHSALAVLSRRGFAAEAVIETLLDQVRDGNLFMPTMTWRTITPSQPDWDELETPSHTGILTELFRTRYAVARSIHPTHSVAGWGRDAQTLLARHHVEPTPVSANSPYGLMRDYDAYILLVGVGLESCTAIHLPEETISPDTYLLPPQTAELYNCRDRLGTVHKVWTRRHRRLDRDFPQFAHPLMAEGKLECGSVEGCPYTIVSLADLLREVFRALIDDPSATLRRGSAQQSRSEQSLMQSIS
jgi:aminoglycoside 3-N-acetyltransferase